jgi:hypothetical protein
MDRWAIGVTLALLAGEFSAGGRATAASPYEELAAKLPADTNLVMAADLQALLRSELGAEKHWADKAAKDFRSGMINTPPTALRLVVGESFDYATLQTRWRVKVNQLSKDANPDRIAEKFGGSPDVVGGVPVVVCPNDQLFVNYAPTLVGELNGVQRQELARLLRTTARAKTPGFSSYLKGLLGTVGSSAQVVMAFDLEDVFHTSGLQSKLKDSKALKDSKVDVAKLATTLEGLLGVQIRMKVTSEIQGELRLDFSAAPEPMRFVGKALVLEVLDHVGASLDDLDDWTPSVEGNSFVLRGKLSPTGARLLLSVVDNRASRQAYIESQTQDHPKLDAKGLATVEYYRSVVAMLEDIEPGASKGNSTDKRIMYYKQYAEKIDSLPILNVDPQVLAFGQAVSITLRNLSRAQKSAKTNVTNIMSQYSADFAMNTYSGGYAYGGYGGYGYGGYTYSAYTPSAVNVDNWPQIQAMLATNAQSSQAAREQTWVNIKQAKTAMRRYLTDKYKVEV